MTSSPIASLTIRRYQGLFNRKLAASASDGFPIAQLKELEAVPKRASLANPSIGCHCTEWQRKVQIDDLADGNFYPQYG